MKTCKEVNKQLIFMADDSLHAEKHEMLFQHLKECPQCYYRFQTIRSALSIIDREKIKESNPFFSEKVMSGIKNQNGSSVNFFPIQSIKILKPAIAAVLVGASVYVGIFLGTNFASGVYWHENKMQSFADEYYLNDLGLENIEMTLITQNK